MSVKIGPGTQEAQHLKRHSDVISMPAFHFYQPTDSILSSPVNYALYAMSYPQHSDRIVAKDSMTSLYPRRP